MEQRDREQRLLDLGRTGDVASDVTVGGIPCEERLARRSDVTRHADTDPGREHVERGGRALGQVAPEGDRA